MMQALTTAMLAKRWEPKAISTLQLAERWCVSKTTIIRMMKRGDLKRMDFQLIRFDMDQIRKIEAGEIMPKTGLVYFLRGAGLIKIGHTIDIIYRLRGLKASSPVPIDLLFSLPGDTDLERSLHSRFAEYRSHGEWFQEIGELADFINKRGAR